ncbi:MAG: C25 family cysteine peptidase, partial [Candidatus Hatepunaea meridiana]|nr:C25 family cysteine peptidase [Candidatus Hatepunaea meridiana]
MKFYSYVLTIFIFASVCIAGVDYSFDLDSDMININSDRGEHSISFSGSFPTFSEGYPTIPAKSIRLVIPENFVPTDIRISSIEPISLEGQFNIMPGKYQILNDHDRISQVEKNPNMYFIDEYYPKTLAKITGTGMLLGAKVVDVLVYPMQYNPVTGSLRYFETIDFTIEGRSEETDDKVLYATIRNINKTKKYINSIIDNPQDLNSCFRTPSVISSSFDRKTAGGVPQRDSEEERSAVPLEYVIITTDALANSFNDLAQDKRDRGIHASVVTLETIRAQFPNVGDDSEAIHLFLARAWRLRSLQWVLIGGDTDIIPTRMILTQEEKRFIATDMYYSCLGKGWNTNKNAYIGDLKNRWRESDQIDLYPKVWVGRAPVRNVQEANDFVSKINDYQTYFDNPQQYREKALFIESDMLTAGDSELTGSILEDLLPDNVTKVHHNETNENLNLNSVTASLNSGYSLIFSFGHGNEYKLKCGSDDLTRLNMMNLTNENKYGLWIAVSCEPGMFNSDCIGEAWIRNQDGGGIGFIGASSYDYPYISTQFFISAFEELVTEGSAYSMGEVLAKSKIDNIAYAQRYGATRTIFMGYNLLGDPEAYIWTDEPHDFEENFPGAYSAGQSNNANLDIEDDLTNADVPHVSLSLSVDEDFYYSTFSDKDGVLETGSFFPDSVVTNAKLYVVAPNYKPFTTTIPIIKGSNYPSITNYALTDVTGNIENELVDAGETFLIDVYVYNSNISSFSDISCTISSTSSEVEEITTS